ncbi:hypothetical protein Nocox_36370 [Nonomuraea coxensis DSM 45129]|uniref:Uncharacterized protein n=1 Tax=Nonomuraea coxensis DSM 45129 TaxID=1122611 RepID=A0ABX8UAP8_9ACTN|nr:hypothetical protein [Nonomuraea coxensis]QYC44828.1 hypothetical protein Nocox_36370 [Nonomuraea coxensis DSM 45129]
MPKLRSVIAGLAISTAMTGGAVVASAATSAANASAATQAGVGTNVTVGWGCGRRCGWGGWGGWRRHHKQRVRVNVHNDNFNRNFFHRRDHEFRRHHHHEVPGSIWLNGNRELAQNRGDLATNREATTN